MGCSACQDKPKATCGKSCGKLPPVLQINSEECPVLFHTVELEGNPTDDGNEPYIGRYKNVLLAYKGDESKWLFNSDGIPSKLTKDFSDIDFNQVSNRPKYAGEEMTGETDIPDVEATVATETTARETADTALGDRIDSTNTAIVSETNARTTADANLQNEINTIDTAIDTAVMTDVEVSPNTSTTVVQLDTTKKNLKTSVTTTDSVPLPVASTTQAGVMNSATFNAIAQNTQDIANIKGEVVAISGLPANPTQAELTTAWMNASGESELINGAGIYDVTNAKRWTYYSNDTTWHYLDASGSVSVNTWTNSAAGIVKGSTNVGQVFAESDGTGSVNGWDALSGQVSTNTSKLSTIASGAEVNVQSDWTQTSTSADDYIKNKPTIDTALSSSSTNAVQNKAIDAEFDKVAYVGNTITTPSSTSFVGTDIVTTLQNRNGDNVFPIAGGMASDSINTQMLKDGAVTSDKIDETTVDLMQYKSSLVSSGTAIARTKGGVAIVTLSVTVQSSTTGEQTIFTLPAGIRPKDMPVVFSAATTTGTVVMVRTKGNDIVFNFTTTSAFGLLATGSYISG